MDDPGTLSTTKYPKALLFSTFVIPLFFNMRHIINKLDLLSSLHTLYKNMEIDS